MAASYQVHNTFLLNGLIMLMTCEDPPSGRGDRDWAEDKKEFCVSEDGRTEHTHI